MPSNSAAFITAPKARPLEVRNAPYTSPNENEIVIKNGALAINPIDWLMQDVGTMAFPWVKYPAIIGTDVAGEVVETGSRVTRFKVGDRVVGFAVGVVQNRNRPAECAFQSYTILLDYLSSPIPDTLSYEAAAVLPLGISTAASGLFEKDQLGLQHPSVPPKPTGKTVLIWGGSTSVGSNAIQLAVAAGYEVITTASPKNFDYVKQLGASNAFDYNSATAVPDIIRAFKGKTTAGALSIGKGAAEACLEILDKCDGNKFIALASYPVPQPPPKYLVLLRTIFYFVSWSLWMWFKSRALGVGNKLVVSTTLVDSEVGRAIFEDFLGEALAKGAYVAAPEPIIVGKGLEFVQAGLDLQKQGVSAKKVVVSL